MTVQDAIKKNIADVIVKLHGWCTPEKSDMLIDLVTEIKPKVSVEIGVYGGRSFIPIVMAHKINHYGLAYGIDPWEATESIKGLDKANYEWWEKIDHEMIYRAFLDAMLKLEITDRARVLRMTSEEAAPFFTEINFLHIDGNHSEERSVSDVELYVPKVTSGGYIVFDDYNCFATHHACKMLDDHFEVIKDIDTSRIYRKK